MSCSLVFLIIRLAKNKTVKRCFAWGGGDFHRRFFIKHEGVKMKKLSLGVLSAALFIVPFASGAMASTCICPGTGCYSDGQYWPYCSECVGYCSTSGSSAATAPVTSTFLKNNFTIPEAILTKPSPFSGNWTPSMQPLDKRKQLDLLIAELRKLQKKAEDAGAAVAKAKWDARNARAEAKEARDRAYRLQNEQLETKEAREIAAQLVPLLEKKAEDWEAKAKALEEAAQKAAEEAKRLEDEVKKAIAQRDALINQVLDEEKKAHAEAEKKALEDAARQEVKEKLAEAKDRPGIENAVKKADEELVKARDAEAKAAEKAAAVEARLQAWIQECEKAADRADLSEEYWNDLEARGVQVSEEKRAAEDALFDAGREREKAEIRAAVMREEAKKSI